MAKIVKSESLTVLDQHSGFLCGRTQIIGDERGRVERFPSLGYHRRKQKIRWLPPAIAHGQKEEPWAPAFQQAPSTTASTVRCETPGRIARIPAISADTVAFAAERRAATSSAL